MAKNTIRNSMYFLLCVFLRSYRIWLIRVYCVGVISICENVTNLASLDFAKFSRISITPTQYTLRKPNSILAKKKRTAQIYILLRKVSFQKGCLKVPKYE